MKFKLFAILMVLLLVTPLPPALSEGSSLLSVEVLNDTIPALPGSTVVVPFTITNLGNETISNVTVYVTGPAEGFQYSVKVIWTPIGPGESLNDTITVNVLNPDAGLYLLTLVAKSGRAYATSKFVVDVKRVIDYSISVKTPQKYIYGHKITALLEVTSRANTILTGRIGYAVLRNGVPLLNESVVTFIKPGSSWVKELSWESLPVGNYTVFLWANFSGLYKSTSASFEVYQRNLYYDVGFRDGTIYIRVYNATGSVPDIPVEINGLKFSTGPDGTLMYSVSSPGRYTVVLNLDGRIVTTFVDVKKLIVTPEVLEGAIAVKVVDSTGIPVSNVTIVASGPKGTDYAVTNSSGVGIVNLSKIGYGSIVIKATSDRYLPGEAVVTVQKPPSPTTTSNTTPTENSTAASPQSNVTLPSTSGTREEPGGSNYLGIILILAGVTFAVTSYLALAAPAVREETLDRYYFIKVRAPRLRSLKNYRIERRINAVEVRATKGEAKLENGKLIWELDLEPGEEAYLQAVLG